MIIYLEDFFAPGPSSRQRKHYEVKEGITGYRGAFLGGAFLAVLAFLIANLGISAPAVKAAETGD